MGLLSEAEAGEEIKGLLPRNWGLLSLSPDEERLFQQWIYRHPHTTLLAHAVGVRPSWIAEEIINNPSPDYDYRRAWREGTDWAMDPNDGTLHGGSMSREGNWLKSPEHPTSWKQAFAMILGDEFGDEWRWPSNVRTFPQAAKWLSGFRNYGAL